MVPVGRGRAVRLRRFGLPFTATEAARADALVRAALPAEPRRTADPAVVEIRPRLDGRPAGPGALAGWPGDRHL